jgi:hypothetical protein
LVKRGVCTYSNKAYEGTMVGALAILVYHDEPGYQVQSTIPYEDSVYKRPKTPIILINNSDGLSILETLKTQEVFMIFKNYLEGKTKNKIVMEYWVGPSNHRAYKFLVKTKELLDSFGNHVEFKPKVKFLDLKGKHNEEHLRTKCYSEGSYCSVEKEFPFENLDEGIKQICIFKHA